MAESFTSLHGNLTTPQSIFVKVGEAVHNDGDWKDDGECSKNSAEASYELSHSRHGCDITYKTNQIGGLKCKRLCIEISSKNPKPWC